MIRITTLEAAKRMQVGEQAIRMMIQLGKIPGAFCYATKNTRRTYYITDVQVEDAMKGRKGQ